VLSEFNGFKSIDNLNRLDAYKVKQDDKTELISYHEKLHALIEVHSKSLESLTLLQQSWVDNVENDLASKDELHLFKDKHSKFNDFCHEHHESADGTLLAQQVVEASEGIESASQNFEQFKEANDERNKVFSNFRKDNTVESLDEFKNELLKHLSQSIVVKESRHRYQKE